jgi:hypothetical protein
MDSWGLDILLTDLAFGLGEAWLIVDYYFD